MPVVAIGMKMIMGKSKDDPNAPGEEEDANPGPVLTKIFRKPGPSKPWTGYRVEENSTVKVKHNRKTIAVVEYDHETLINCELLSVSTNADRDAALKSIAARDPKANQTEIDFPDMLNLMEQCRTLPTPSKYENYILTKLINPVPALSLNGIIIAPGTKWCGGGSQAKNYYDLGEVENVDRCCRNHDFCPTTIGPFKKQFNVTNISPKTLLDCACDELFYNCLKATESTYGDIIGNIYFNAINGDCVRCVKLGTAPNSLKYD